jgi:elongator complex protein 1
MTRQRLSIKTWLAARAPGAYHQSRREVVADFIRLAGSDKVNSVCDALRTLLEQKDLVKYVETILTAHVCKQPSDYESGLRVLLRLQGELFNIPPPIVANADPGLVDHPNIVEEAIKYIIFLSDVDRLYDVALGMYNFELVLMIAQYSQKVSETRCRGAADTCYQDPKEYLPFLRELRALDRHEQRFRIDDHLGRRTSALRNLKDAGTMKP